jgi:hypothetical protein
VVNGPIVGLGGLLVATCTITEANASWFWVPERVTDVVILVRAAIIFAQHSQNIPSIHTR